MDKSETLIVNNITVASGYKCEKCGLIRPYSMEECPRKHENKTIT